MTRSRAAYLLIAAPAGALVTSLREFAREQALDAIVVSDGEAALGVVHARGAPRLLVTELTLAKLDGFALVREVRKRVTAERMPVVVSSPFATLRAHASRLQEKLGITAVVSPAVDPGELEHVWRGALAVTDPVVWIDLDDPRDQAVREAARLGELERMIDVRPPQQLMSMELAAIARQFGVTTVLVTLVDRDRVVFKASHGLPHAFSGETSAPRSTSFCRHVVEADVPAPLIVPDAAMHPAFANNPHVLDGTVGSYVGVPLTSPLGNVLGTLCVVDPLPWLGSSALVDALAARAHHVTAMVLDHCDTCSDTWRSAEPIDAATAAPHAVG